MKYSGGLVRKSLVLKFLEQLLTKGTSLVVNIVLARLLNVEDFGSIAILTVFTSLASAIIEGGLSTSLVQMKDIDEHDYSTVFVTSALLAIIMYILLFLTAPFIASYYNEPNLSLYLRVIGCVLFTTPFNATQLGYVYRHMLFKKLLVATVMASLISGGVAIVMAYWGLGVWALLAHSLLFSMVSVIVLLILLPWRPKIYFSAPLLKRHFSFGWKLLVASLLETLYNDVRSLVIGNRYSKTDLSYFNRGETYPKTVITSLNTTVQTIMLPTMSSHQDDPEGLKKLVRKSVSMSAFCLFPIMAIFAGAADGFVRIVLTEKWLPCVPFLQLSCLAYAIQPINACNLQALKAIGRSDMYLLLTIIKKIIGFAIIFFTAFCFKTPLAIAVGVAIYAPIQLLINATPNQKLIYYSLWEQLKDIALPALLSIVTFVSVYMITFVHLNVWLTVILQGVIGVLVYVGLALLLRVDAMRTFQAILKNKRKHKE